MNYGDSNQQHRGEVGGKLTLYCSSNKHKEIKLFYLQRNSGQHNVEFVNGFYENRNISNTWPGTTLDRNNTSVHFHNLKVSNNGNYQCIIVYKDEGKSEETHRVFVTAPYSKPTVSVNCSDESHSYICMVTCSSHGGYPATKVTWNISVPVNHSGEAWKVFSSSEVSDPNSKLVNSSSTAHFNCSNRVPQSFGCSVGIVISDTFTVCEYCILNYKRLNVLFSKE
ncbi:CD276 antigen-like [Thalassophryne amazonica]|uniref:CD276 antigen-like n=1 Tax=Thalassophryne amazonica TaxID=390379 RepID=UPI001471B2D7|nr:CD276 antigen-like [Thalassophryne amazonica]